MDNKEICKDKKVGSSTHSIKAIPIVSGIIETNTNRRPFPSIVSECTELKDRYQQCFDHWFSKVYIKPGSSVADRSNSPCDSLFISYKECLEKVCNSRFCFY